MLLRAASLLVLFSLTCMAAPPAPGTLEALDRKSGFRDVTFGMTLEQVVGLQETGVDGEVKLYQRQSDSLELGSAKLVSIRYGFVEGRLVMVDIRADAENADALLRAFQAAYGPGKLKSAISPDRMWMGQRVMMLFSRARDVARVGLVDKSYIARQLQQREQKDAKADL